MRASDRLFLKNRRGNAATEFAFILPIMLLFIGGIVEFGRAFQAYNAVNRLATRYAIVYADCFDNPAGQCDNNSGDELATMSSANAIKNMAPQLSPAPTVRIFQVLMSNTASPTATVVYTNASPATLNTSETQQVQAAIGQAQYGVVVTVSYTYSPMFFSNYVPSGLASRLITYTVAQRKN